MLHIHFKCVVVEYVNCGHAEVSQAHRLGRKVCRVSLDADGMHDIITPMLYITVAAAAATYRQGLRLPG